MSKEFVCVPKDLLDCYLSGEGGDWVEAGQQLRDILKATSPVDSEAILARVFYHYLPDEDDYEVHDEEAMSGECEGCIPAYIVRRSHFENDR